MIEDVRDMIVELHSDYLQNKGLSLEDATESDLTVNQIRKLSNIQLKTLCRWKKIPSVAAMPTKKAELATRLIETMDRTSPHASPYNSDDEELEDGGEDDEESGEDEVA